MRYQAGLAVVGGLVKGSIPCYASYQGKACTWEEKDESGYNCPHLMLAGLFGVIAACLSAHEPRYIVVSLSYISGIDST